MTKSCPLTITVDRIPWVWDPRRDAYVVESADGEPSPLPFTVSYQGDDKESIFHGWTMLHTGCGMNVSGKKSPNAAMLTGAGEVRQEARRQLVRAARALAQARATADLVGASHPQLKGGPING